MGPRPSEQFDDRTLWWRHEQLHRAAIVRDFGQVLDDIRPERDLLEQQFLARVDSALDAGTDARAWVQADCWRQALEAEERWRERLKTMPRAAATSYIESWERLNRFAGLAISL
jgi:hypothetical protein